MQPPTPRIAVLVCTHNGAPYLEQQLSSLVKQAHVPALIVVHDWGSSDGTRAVLANFATRPDLPCPVHIHMHETVPGASRSFVAGMRQCVEEEEDFDYLALCDQDDEWLPNKLATYALHINQSNPAPTLLFSDVALVDVAAQPLAASFYGRRSPFLPPHQIAHAGLALTNPVIGMTLCIARPQLRTLLPHLDGPWLMHDWALVLLAAAQSLLIRYVPQALVRYRQHGGNLLGAAQGLRLLARLKKGRTHFRRLRDQLVLLQACTDASPHLFARSPFTEGLLKVGPSQRWQVSLAALRSPLLKRPAGLLLACAVILLW